MYPVKENYYLDGFLSVMPNTYGSDDIQNNSRFCLSIGIHHRFNYKSLPVQKEK